jgi:hypothetical protein
MMLTIRQGFGAAVLLTLAACASTPPSGPQDQFLTALRALCGQSFEGRVVTSDPVDAGIAAQRLVIHVRDCSHEAIRIPYHVGDNRSRTWVITRTPGDALRLKHEHRHEDGALDALSNYGGDTVNPGSPTRQEFPADAYSRSMFTANGNAAAEENVWAMEMSMGRVFAYELRRPNRHFRVEFDLTAPVPTPPPPWGAN